MKPITSDDVDVMLTATGMDPTEWDSAALAEVLGVQWAQIDAVRAGLSPTDEPSLWFNPRWE